MFKDKKVLVAGGTGTQLNGIGKHINPKKALESR